MSGSRGERFDPDTGFPPQTACNPCHVRRGTRATGLVLLWQRMTATAAQTSLLQAPTLTRDTGHLKELDGLRAIAIALVIAQHLFPLHRIIPHPEGMRPQNVVPPLGFIGVSLFFVLSGFLITRILLACRQRVDLHQVPRRRELGVFYLRRTLRIFPLYYATLLVLWLLDVRHIRDRIAWHATYTSNWLFCDLSVYNAGGFERHFWSLATEEQFYLVWPWLILLTPRRLLGPALFATFLLGPLWRAWFVLRVGPQGQTWPWMWSQFPTPANVDLLAAGGIVALAWTTRWRRPLLWMCLLLGLPAAAVSVGAFRTEWLLDTRRVLQQTALALVFGALVGFAGQGIPIIGKALSWRPMAYVGKISYGLYVLHNFAPPALRWMLAKLEMASFEREHTWLFAWTTLAMTFAISMLSWHLFEWPLNRLKNRVPYK